MRCVQHERKDRLRYSLVVLILVVIVLISGASALPAATTTTTAASTPPTSATANTSTTTTVPNPTVFADPSTIRPGEGFIARGSCGYPGFFYASPYVETLSGQLTGWNGFGHVAGDLSFAVTVDVPSDAAPGHYNLFVTCVITADRLPVATSGPSPLTIAGSPISSPATAVTATPTLTG